MPRRHLWTCMFQFPTIWDRDIWHPLHLCCVLQSLLLDNILMLYRSTITDIWTLIFLDHFLLLGTAIPHRTSQNNCSSQVLFGNVLCSSDYILKSLFITCSAKFLSHVKCCIALVKLYIFLSPASWVSFPFFKVRFLETYKKPLQIWLSGGLTLFWEGPLLETSE